MNNFVDLVEFPGYKINREGDVIGLKGTVLAQSPNVDGYPVVYLRKDGKNCCVRVHRLLAKTFIPNPNNLPVVNHIDGVKSNNSLSNLEWTTVQGNVDHAISVLKINKKGAAQITEDLVHLICKDLESGLKQKEIYTKHNTSQSIVNRIKNGITWPEISSQYNVNVRGMRIKVETIYKICEHLNNGLKNAEVVRALNDPEVTLSVVSKMSNFKCYEHITKDILKSKEERSQTRAKARTLKWVEMVGPL